MEDKREIKAADKANDTKRRIIDKALELFSTRGYDSVSVGEIAKAVGIKAPSLYNHFSGKQAIFDAIVEATAAQPGMWLCGLVDGYPVTRFLAPCERRWVPLVHGMSADHTRMVSLVKETQAMPGAPGRNQPCPCGSGKKYKHCCGAGK